ncbi:MAG: hypothetical protein ACRYG6_14390 [Janthinobacterium lividum]
MSDSAHVGDAARLEAALERIVSALGRATPSPAAPPDSHHPDQDAPPGPAAFAIDVAQIGARLDGLIAELRDVLGEDSAPPGPPSHPA